MSKRVKETTALVAESVSKRSLSEKHPRTLNSIEVTRIRHHTYANAMDTIFKIVRTISRAGAFCLVAYFLYRSVASITNTKTDFKVVIDSVMAFGVNQWVAYAVAALCGVGYIHERRLRAKANKDQGNYIKELETKLDPKRSSSQPTEEDPKVGEDERSKEEDSDAI